MAAQYKSARVGNIGANIDLAALFWLTRRPDCRVWCYEPNPQNVARLRALFLVSGGFVGWVLNGWGGR
jgi:hypothetical protein